MTYTVTFYALRLGLADVVVSVHHIEQNVLAAYTGRPNMVLAAARTVKSNVQADAYRIVDVEGWIILDYIERVR